VSGQRVKRVRGREGERENELGSVGMREKVEKGKERERVRRQEGEKENELEGS
jgi:hypothetical protein